MSNIMQDLHTLGLNPFAVTLLAESLLKSPLAPMTVGKPQGFFFPVKRADCAGWDGVRITLEAVHSLATQPEQQAEDWPCPEPYATEINRLRNVIQAACSGGLGHMIERWKVLFPDAPVPTVRRQPAAEVPDDVGRLGKNQPLYLNLRSLAVNPTAAISAYGDEWAGWCAASALDALAAAKPAAAVPADERFSWLDFKDIADLPEVDEAIRSLLEDRTDDNAVCVVRAVVEAAGARLVRLAASPSAQEQRT